MPAKIDTAYVRALIEQALFDGLDGSLVSYVMSNAPPAEGLAAWAQLVAVDATPLDRQKRSGEVDAARLVVAVNVAVGASKTKAHALQGALRVVADALDEWVVDETASNGHQIELERARTAPDAGFGEEPGVRTGSVIVEGIAMRSTGLTRTTYL